MHDDSNHHDQAFNTATQPELLKLQGRQDRISFSGVTFRNFALKANINHLQMFCDNYLNFADDSGDHSGHYFKAAAPFVTLAVLNYGRMSTESENLGWIAQHEVLFSVPVEWYRVNEKGQLVFHDWAYVCPFIFVDNDQSLGVGREVYGWSKVRAWLQPVNTSWTADPREPRKLMSLASEMFPKLYAGEAQEARTLIEIIQDAPPNILRSPFRADDPNNLWWSSSRNLRNAASAMTDALEFVSGLPLFGYDRSRNAATLGLMYRRLMQYMASGVPWLTRGHDTLEAALARSRQNPASPYMNNLTLKQFRDAEQPQIACYQGLVKSRIAVERLYDGGLLGAPSLAVGDVSGGYRIHVHEYAEQPIIDTLGIEVTDTVRNEHGGKVAVLTPVLPFWMACDLRYDMGETLAWRTGDSRWTDDTHCQPPPRADGCKNQFNTTRGAAMQDSVGPFHSPDTTLRVFPLLADSEQLQAFCDEYINKLNVNVAEEVAAYEMGLPPGAVGAGAGAPGEQIQDNYFEAWGNYVYLVVTNYGEEIGRRYSESNNLGQTARREVAVWLPVKWTSKDPDTGKPVLRTAFLTPYVFCDSMRHALTESEVNGRPAIHSRIDSNDDYWLRESGPVAEDKMLATLRTILMPALNVGQPAEMRELLNIREGDLAGYNEDIPWAVIKANWEPTLVADYERKVKEKRQWTGTADGDGNGAAEDTGWEQLKQMFTDVVSNELPMNFITLKQYRATTEVDKHCYQALVLVQKSIGTLWDIREMPTRMHVGIHEYPTMPIVKRLGIKVKSVDAREHSVVPQMEAIRPFFIRASMTESVGINLFTRVVGQRWTQPPQRAVDKVPAPDEKTQEVLRRIKEPKAVLESILWDSWGGHDSTNPYRDENTRRQPDGAVSDGFEEFFMRARSYGMGAVNTQVFKANKNRRNKD